VLLTPQFSGTGSTGTGTGGTYETRSDYGVPTGSKYLFSQIDAFNDSKKA